MNKCILFIITKSETGGAQKFVAEQIRICKNDNYRVLLATNQQDWLTDEVKDLADEVLLDKRIESRTSVLYLLKLIKFIKRYKADLVVCNSANAGLYGRIAAYWCGIRSIYVTHGWGAIYNGGKLASLLFTIERILAKIGTSTLCISDADFNNAKEKIGIPVKKLYLIKNCIPPVQPLSPPLLTPKNGKLRLLSVARFSHPKRMDLLSMAMKGLDDVELYLVGTGRLLDDVQALVKDNGLKNVHFLGEIHRFDRFADFDAFSLISDSEGLSISALEAISAGLPVMLSNVGGCAELVENNGVLVNNNLTDIRNGIRMLSDNLNFYRSNAIPFFNKHFNLELNKHKYLDYYRSILKENTPG
jgi:glycosyltransferase involved in cell wall biosynthesis